MKHEPIPADWPVQPVDASNAVDPATCGHCNLTWDDATATSMTPAPAARCPFEPFHVYPSTVADALGDNPMTLALDPEIRAIDPESYVGTLVVALCTHVSAMLMLDDGNFEHDLRERIIAAASAQANVWYFG